MKIETAHYIYALFASFCENLVTKCVSSIAFGYYIFFFDVNLIEASKALTVLIVLDFITAVVAAKKTGEHIKSAKVFRTPIKFIVYGILISASHLMETVTPALSILDESMMSFLALTELISIIENTGRMGFAVPQKLLNQLQDWQKNK